MGMLRPVCVAFTTLCTMTVIATSPGMSEQSCRGQTPNEVPPAPPPSPFGWTLTIQTEINSAVPHVGRVPVRASRVPTIFRIPIENSLAALGKSNSLVDGSVVYPYQTAELEGDGRLEPDVAHGAAS